MESKGQDSIQVFIRIRPIETEDKCLLNFTESQIRLEKNQFAFDKIFPPKAEQAEIFEAVGTKVLTHTLEGYNASVFAYGQTGSGKTYTMVGEDRGLMQRSFHELFKRIYALPDVDSSITCSYFEIYNEQIIDLLDLKKDKKMNIRQNMRRGVFVDNLVEENVYGPEKLLQCLALGLKNRHMGETMMNRESSRSHSIFTISISLRMQVDGKKILKTPKLHFIDLAGSERQKLTATTGERLKEASNINKSLTTLGMVINALTSQKQRNHIPYRDSKLTNLLRDSLGGNSKTFIIGTISSSVLCFQETLSTLNFANRAKMVQVKAHINEQSLINNIQTYKDQIRRLKTEIIRLKSTKGFPSFDAMAKSASQLRSYDDYFKELNNKVNVISDQLSKNSISPTIQNLMQSLEKIKSKSIASEDNEVLQMNMQEFDEEGPLFDYSASKNQLLEKIHSKYAEIKDQLKSMVYQDQLSIAELKTPSKCEREQYEDKILEKDKEIAHLYSEIKTLNEKIAESIMVLKGLNNQAMLSNGQISEKEVLIEKIGKSLNSLESQVMLLKKNLKQAQLEKQILEKKLEQVSVECKENKELYYYSEDKFKTEKKIRQKFQIQVEYKVKQIESLKEKYQKEMEDNQEKFEQREENLLQQIGILTETVEFNKKIASQYKQKWKNEKQSIDEIALKLQETQKMLFEGKAQLDQKVNQLKILRSQFQHYEKKSALQYQKIKQNLDECTQKYQQMCVRYDELIKKKERQSEEQRIQQQKKQEELNKKALIMKQSEMKLQKLEKQYKANRQVILEQHESQKDFFKKSIMEEAEQNRLTIFKLQQDVSDQKKSNVQLLNKYIIQQKKRGQLTNQNRKIKSEFYKKNDQVQKIIEMREKQIEKCSFESNDLKKKYTDLVKQHYQLKSKVGGNARKNEQELRNKAKFYEQKFIHLSRNYHQAMIVVNKLKEKQLNQSQKISFLEESQRSNQIGIDSQNSSLFKALKDQNQSLKKEIQLIKSDNDSKNVLTRNDLVDEKIESLEKKEEQVRRKIQMSINRCDPSKDKQTKNKSLDELIYEWEKVIDEGERQFSETKKEMKKQQKLKTQNNMILGQNIYLKGQIQEIEGMPRKKVKKDMDSDQ